MALSSSHSWFTFQEFGLLIQDTPLVYYIDGIMPKEEADTSMLDKRCEKNSESIQVSAMPVAFLGMEEISGI